MIWTVLLTLWSGDLAQWLNTRMPTQGLRVRSPSLQLKLLEKEICTGSSQDKCSRVSVLYTGHVKVPGLSCVVGAPVSCTLGH